MKLELIASDPSDYLGSDEVIDLDHPELQALAHQLRASHLDDADFARAAYEWVRDEVSHSFDAQDSRVTLTASEALRQRVGLCYAKAHLLTALLRAQGVPTGLCYQRLADEATNGAVVHGLVAIHLNNSWHRQDPRGNKPGVDAQFSLGEERLAWTVDPRQGELDYPTLHVRPHPRVVESLRRADNILELYGSGLPQDLNEY